MIDEGDTLAMTMQDRQKTYEGKALLLFVALFVFGGSWAWAGTGKSEKALWKKCGKRCQTRLHLMSPRQINQLLPFLQKTFTYHERLRLLSRMFLRAPYSFGPLGEGTRGRWDRDPIFRMDRVDCVTYVETVMALAASSRLKEARKKLQAIRYEQARVRFAWRNHFTAAQWLPINQKAGYIAPLTRQVGGKWTRLLHKPVPLSTWSKRRWRRWARRLPPKRRPRAYVIPYIPLKDLSRVLSRFPAIGWMGEIFSQQGNPISVRHVGFVVRRKGKVWFRHANRPRVAEIPLLQYARRRMRQARRKQARVRIIGFSFASFSNPFQPHK